MNSLETDKLWESPTLGLDLIKFCSAIFMLGDLTNIDIPGDITKFYNSEKKTIEFSPEYTFEILSIEEHEHCLLYKIKGKALEHFIPQDEIVMQISSELSYLFDSSIKIGGIDEILGDYYMSGINGHVEVFLYSYEFCGSNSKLQLDAAKKNYSLNCSFVLRNWFSGKNEGVDIKKLDQIMGETSQKSHLEFNVIQIDKKPLLFRENLESYFEGFNLSES